MITQELVAGPDGTLNLARGPGGGTPLLLLHGVGRLWQDFVPLAPVLGARWRFHALDFRGHGRSAWTRGKYLVRDYARDAVEILRTHLREPALVFGHSLGALVAAAAAAEVPHLVRGLVLEDPPFECLGAGIRDSPYHSLFLAMQQTSGSTADTAELAARLAEARVAAPGGNGSARLGDLRDPVSLRFMAACLKRLDPALWAPLVEGRWMDGYPVDGVLSGIRAPVLLLQGDPALGGMLDDFAARRAADRMADCTLVRMQGVGHLIHGMQRDPTLRLVTSFFEAVELDRHPG